MTPDPNILYSTDRPSVKVLRLAIAKWDWHPESPVPQDVCDMRAAIIELGGGTDWLETGER